MDENKEQRQERREARRRRRIRNQIIVHFSMVVLVLALGAGIMYGVKCIVDWSGRQKQEQDQEQEAENTEDELPTDEENEEPDDFFHEEPAEELTWLQKLDMIVDARIEVMPLEDKVAGLFIVTPESITGVSTAIKAGDGTKEALTKYSVGGIIYSEKNIKNEEQFKEMIQNTVLYSSYPLFIAIEEEGGSVSPMASSRLMDMVYDAAAIGASGDASNAYLAGTMIGTKLAEYGFNLDFAPVADLNSVENSVIGDRSYGSDAVEAGNYVALMLQGLKDTNVNGCLKHFPGMGSTSQDTDKGLAATERSAEEFRENEFAVFQAGIDAGANMVMVSNMSAPALSGDNTPCTMSSAVVTDLLRGELQYDGVIITDAMDCKAISDYYSADQAAVLALRAGCDMILMPEDFEKAYNGVLEAVQNGEISEERINDALKRIYRIKDAGKIEE